jgi:hypothetical protein
MKKHIYRRGDKVRIVEPKLVRRVGYPLMWREITDEQLYADPRIMRALRAFGLTRHVPFGCTAAVSDNIPRHLQLAFAKEYVLKHGFGGNERSIHYYGGEHMPDNVAFPTIWLDYYGVGTVHEVLTTRRVKTGTRFAGYTQGYGDDEDYHPGGLAGMKVHTLLKLSGEVEIEACNVELVK